MQKDGDRALKGTKLGLGVLHKHVLDTDIPGTSPMPIFMLEVMMLNLMDRGSQSSTRCSGYGGNIYSPIPGQLPLQDHHQHPEEAAEFMGVTEDSLSEDYCSHSGPGDSCHHQSSSEEAGLPWADTFQAGGPLQPVPER